MKSVLAILSIAVMAACGSARSTASVNSVAKSKDTTIGAECPTAPLRGFVGTFKGVLSPVSFQGESQPLQSLLETHTVTSCTSFDFDVHYSDPQTGVETREVKFTAQWDKTKGVFTLAGPVIQGQFRVIREGQFVASFETSFAGSPTHCEEMMTVTNNAQQLMRSVQCVAGGIDGASLGVRNALVSRVP
jgi:hypothetical protein